MSRLCRSGNQSNCAHVLQRNKKTPDVILSMHPQDFSPHLFGRFYRVNCVFVAPAAKNRSGFFEGDCFQSKIFKGYFFGGGFNKILTCLESTHTLLRFKLYSVKQTTGLQVGASIFAKTVQYCDGHCIKPVRDYDTLHK